MSKFKNGREQVDQFDLRDQKNYPMYIYIHILKIINCFHLQDEFQVGWKLPFWVQQPFEMKSGYFWNFKLLIK